MILIIAQVIGLIVIAICLVLNEQIVCNVYSSDTQAKIRVALCVLTIYFELVPLLMYLGGYQKGFLTGVSIISITWALTLILINVND